MLQQSAFRSSMPLMTMGNYPARNFAYHQNVIDHYENPRNVGSLDKKSSSVGTGLVGVHSKQKLLNEIDVFIFCIFFFFLIFLSFQITYRILRMGKFDATDDTQNQSKIRMMEM